MKYFPPHHLTIATLVLLISLLFMSRTVYPYAAQGGSVHGAIFTRGVIQDENGNITYVVYDDTGSESGGVIKKVPQAEAQDYFVMATAQANAMTEQYNTIKSGYPDVEVLGRDAYNALMKPDNKPDIPSYINYVVVRGAAQREIMQDSSQLILQQSVIDPSQTYSGKSMLVQVDGTVIEQSNGNIGLRASFLKDDKNEAIHDAHFSSFISKWRQAGYELVNPLSPVFVASPGYGYDVTDGDGKYAIPYRMFCPFFGHPVTIPVDVELYYSRFNPRGLDLGTYYYQTHRYDYCVGQHILLSASGNLSGLMAYTNILGIITAMARPLVYNDIPIDVFFLTGSANLYGATVSAQTRYNGSRSTLERTAIAARDFDQDGTIDRVAIGKFIDATDDAGEAIKQFTVQPVESAELQGVWLSGQYDIDNLDIINTLPSFTRLLDWSDDYQHRALLSEISEADLKNTDLYVFRESDGTLITERRGLKEEEYNKRDYLGTNGEVIGYTIQMINRFATRNRVDSSLRSVGTFENWQAKGNMNPDFYKREADHLRPGEVIKIVAINRSTGYMGSVRSQLIKSNDSVLLSFHMPHITLFPPNLKIRATRSSDVTSAGKDGIQSIGNEGAGLSDDKMITISTEWVEHDGTPLPAGLEDYGFTGRVARVSAPNVLTAKEGRDQTGNQLAQFSIKPGRQTQLIRLSATELGTEHLYVHVSGEPQKRRPDLSTEELTEGFSGNFDTGAGTGILKYRPSKFVPVKVQIPDETTTSLALDVWRAQKATDPELEKPEPSYRWVYRPEFQVSVYDLEVDKIIRTPDVGEAVDIYISDTGSGLNASDSMLELLYTLTESQFAALEAYSYEGDRELVFSLGGQEILATIGDDQSITFDNLDYIQYLDSDDLLTLTLFSNNDAANVLWEFDFTGTMLVMAVDLNRDGVVDFDELEDSTDEKIADKTSETRPFRFWINDNYDVVNDSGNVNLDITYCAATSGNQVCEQWDQGANEGSNITNPEKIESEKDLEDFAPLAIKIRSPKNEQGYLDPAKKGIQVFMTSKGASINLFKGKWLEGTDYLTDNAVMKKQTLNSASDLHLFTLKDDEERQLSQNDIRKLFGRSEKTHVIFEGTGASDETCITDASDCYLEIVMKKAGEEIASSRIYLNILPLKHFYDHYTAGTGELTELDESLPNLNASYTYTSLFPDDDPEYQDMSEEYILFVHGWRMKQPERVAFGETAFKRLYWSGYKGRYGLFSWPTGWFEKPAHFYNEEYIFAKYVKGNQQNYGDSEVQARLTGDLLDNLLVNLNTGYSVHIFAHSMGNVVVSEALRNAGGQQLVEHYIASQAAEVESAYNPSANWMQYRGFDQTAEGVEAGWRELNLNGLDTEYDMPPNYYSFNVHETHGPTSPALEAQVAQEEGWGPNYYHQIGQAVGKIINFHNSEDIALQSWEINQMTKPDFADGPTWSYNFDWDCPYSTVECAIDLYPDYEDREMVTDIFTRGGNQIFWNLTTPIDEVGAQILGHIIPSRSGALGQNPGAGTGSVINAHREFNFGESNQGHSAQFYNAYINRRNYWNAILDEFGLYDEGSI